MSQASHAKFATEVDAIKSQVRVRRAETDTLFSGTLNDFLGTTSKYDNKLIMQEGELVYVANAVSSKEARWFEELGIQKSSDYYTVEFDTAGGNEIDSQSIKIGKTAKKPKNPTKAGHIFLGWYYLQEGGTENEPTYEEKEFDFNTKIISNYSLYAKYSGEAVLMARNFTKAFWQETYRTKIASIVFTKDSSLIPSSPLNSWDVEADKNCANIKAYLIKDETDNSLYKLIVYSEYTIFANPNALSYFQSFTKLKSIIFDNFDTSKVKSMRAMFRVCSGLTNIDLSKFDTSKVTDMSYMFRECSELTSMDLSKFDTSKVTNMSSMFTKCSKLASLDLSKFDTSKVTNMQYMFLNCSGFTSLDLSSFNTSNVKDMRQMFGECKFTSLNISSFNTSNVIDMSYLFYSCSELTNLNLSNFDTSNVKDMKLMFFNCISLQTLDLNNFNTKKVENMFSLFNNCK